MQPSTPIVLPLVVLPSQHKSFPPDDAGAFDKTVGKVSSLAFEARVGSDDAVEFKDFINTKTCNRSEI